MGEVGLTLREYAGRSHVSADDFIGFGSGMAISLDLIDAALCDDNIGNNLADQVHVDALHRKCRLQLF